MMEAKCLSCFLLLSKTSFVLFGSLIKNHITTNKDKKVGLH